MYTYTGDGHFLNGVPARDLTDDEFAALDPDARERAELSGFYVQSASPATLSAAAGAAEETHEEAPVQVSAVPIYAPNVQIEQSEQSEQSEQ